LDRHLVELDGRALPAAARVHRVQNLVAAAHGLLTLKERDAEPFAVQLTINTGFWTRYRSDSQNPDFGDVLPNAVPDLATGQHPAIPRSDADLAPPDHLQAIANTAGFHFAWIEQGGTSLYAALAQRVTHPEVLRILLSIGGTRSCTSRPGRTKPATPLP
jgi:hypothetical protein